MEYYHHRMELRSSGDGDDTSWPMWLATRGAVMIGDWWWPIDPSCIQSGEWWRWWWQQWCVARGDGHSPLISSVPILLRPSRAEVPFICMVFCLLCQCFGCSLRRANYFGGLVVIIVDCDELWVFPRGSSRVGSVVVCILLFPFFSLSGSRHSNGHLGGRFEGWYCRCRVWSDRLVCQFLVSHVFAEKWMELLLVVDDGGDERALMGYSFSKLEIIFVGWGLGVYWKSHNNNSMPARATVQPQSKTAFITASIVVNLQCKQNQRNSSKWKRKIHHFNSMEQYF